VPEGVREVADEDIRAVIGQDASETYYKLFFNCQYIMGTEEHDAAQLPATAKWCAAASVHRQLNSTSLN